MTGGPLAGVTVVEMATEEAVPFAARLLADLGADVLKIEHADGDTCRRRGDRSPAQPGPLFHLVNVSKSGGWVDPGDDEDAVLLRRLLDGADIVLTDDSAHVRPLLDVAGLALDEPDRPRGNVVGIGRMLPSDDRWPRRSWGSIHACAVSGVSSMIGEPHREPLPLPYDVAAYVGGVNLAAAVTAAHWRTVETGVGQLVEVSAADVLVYFMDVIGCLVTFGAERVYRHGRSMPGSGGVYPFRFFACRDGVVAVTCRSDRDWQALARLVGREDWLSDPQWSDPRVVARAFAQDADAYLEPWFGSQSVADLFARAVADGLPLAPMLTIEQAVAQQSVEHVDHIEVDDRRVPVLRNPAVFSRTPGTDRGLDVPRFGHRLDADTVRRWTARREGPTPRAVETTTDARLLDGLRVIDLAWVWSGPMASASLADLGADVIKVEHRGRLDNTRLRGRPTLAGRTISPEAPDEELSIYNHMVNRGKRSITLDMKHPDGRRVLAELLAGADVVIENLPPGTFDRHGVGYDATAARNPGVVWLSMRSLGGSGPLQSLRAYAPVMSSLAGIEGLAGYRDEPPVGMVNFALADPNASSYALLAVLAALVERRRSGRGQHVELSQVAALTADLCAPVAMAATGVAPGPLGARHAEHVPSGHYPGAGAEEWVALVVTDDEEWQRLVGAIGDVRLERPELKAAAARRPHADDIDAVIAAWTRRRSSNASAEVLQAAGVAAVAVLGYEESRVLFDDDIQHVEHRYLGDEGILGVPWRYSLTPPSIQRPAPLIGEHTAEVLAELDGVADECDELLQSPGLT